MHHLVDILKRFKWGIVLALSLVAIDNIAWIVEPALFGDVIDAFIDINAGEQQAGTHWLPLLLWIGAFAINSGVGALRRSVDQKIFLNMFAEIAASVAPISSIPLSIHSSINPLSINPSRNDRQIHPARNPCVD